LDNITVENITSDSVFNAAGEECVRLTTIIEWDWWLHKDFIKNANKSGGHWAANGNHKKTEALRMFGVAHHRKLGRYKKVQVDATVSYPVNRQRDVQNLQPTMKAYVDGLVDRPKPVKGQKQGPARGILVDDDDAHLLGPFLHPSGVRSGRKDLYLFRVKLTILE